jgi:hypothetical protein
VKRFPLDAALVPAGLLLIARELLLFAPTRELAWQLTHDARVARRSAWLGFLLPRPSPELDADPVALLLGSLAVLLAGAYLVAGWRGASARVRAAWLGVAALVLVVLPTLALVGLGAAMRLPYGHDGGVVQLPLALDKVLAGESPYGADYSRSVLGRQSRASEFWAPLGGNPITRHHWYLPGVHLLMIPPYVLLEALLGCFDPRLVTLPGFLLAAWLASRLVHGDERRLCAAALVLVHPLVWWPQVFGVNDIFCALPLLLALLLAERGRRWPAAACLGLACAVKQLMWPFAPFLLLHLAHVRSWRELASAAGLRRLAAAAGATLAVAAAVVLPIALRDWTAFVNDIFRYQVGLPGEDQYPLGGTPGFGFANFVIYFGWVKSLGDAFPFGRFYALLIPLGLLLVHRQLRRPGIAAVLVNGSLALLASLYLSRIVNPNYLTLAAVFIPLAVLRDRRLPADLAVVPLAMMTLGLEFSGRELLRTTWQAAETLGFVPGLPAWLAPGAGPRWRDPLSLGFSAVAVGLAIIYLLVTWSRAGADGNGADAAPLRWRARAAFVGFAGLLLVVLPAWLVVRGGDASRVVRAQGRFVADVRAGLPLQRVDGRWLTPAPTREAWSRSFRKQGERVYAPDEAPRSRLGALLRGPDPRWPVLIALALAALLVARRIAPGARVAVLGALLLSPLGAVGAIFGAGEPLALLALLLAGRGLGADLVALGLASFVPAAWPAWLASASATVRQRSTAILYAAGAGAILLLTLARPSPAPPLIEATLPTLPVRAAEVAVGLTSLAAYHGHEGAAWVAAWARLAPWAFILWGVIWVWRRGQATGWAARATLLLSATWLWPWAEPHALLLPFAGALLAVAARERDA